MKYLGRDLIRNIAFGLKFTEILKFSVINTFLYKTIDNIFYKKLAVIYYSKNFWNRALERPIFFSKPLNNIKMELIRIEKFQLTLEKHNIKRWCQKDFYDYWKYNDKFIEK